MAKYLPLIFVALMLLLLPRTVYAQGYIPQVTFGDILNNNWQKAPKDTTGNDRRKLVQDFLKRLEDNGKDSKTAFYGANPTPKDNSLTGDIAGFFTTPVPTLNPRLENILAQAQNLKVPAIALPSSIGQSDLVQPVKSSYTIAILGDSMTDTLGENLPHLSNILKESYPKTNFMLLNYGQGATNIESGLHRLTNPTKYLNRDYPPLLHLQPDIVVVESFAYNHWGSGIEDLNRQWLTAVKILETVKNYKKDTKIIFLATISPNPKIFGDGILNWPENLKWDSSITTKAYLQNFIGLANSAGIPLADAYTSSLSGEGFGDPRFIDAHDHLHPSDEGKHLISRKIVETIKNFELIK